MAKMQLHEARMRQIENRILFASQDPTSIADSQDSAEDLMDLSYTIGKSPHIPLDITDFLQQNINDPATRVGYQLPFRL